MPQIAGKAEGTATAFSRLTSINLFPSIQPSSLFSHYSTPHQKNVVMMIRSRVPSTLAAVARAAESRGASLRLEHQMRHNSLQSRLALSLVHRAPSPEHLRPRRSVRRELLDLP